MRLASGRAGSRCPTRSSGPSVSLLSCLCAGLVPRHRLSARWLGQLPGTRRLQSPPDPGSQRGIHDVFLESTSKILSIAWVACTSLDQSLFREILEQEESAFAEPCAPSGEGEALQRKFRRGRSQAGQTPGVHPTLLLLDFRTTQLIRYPVQSSFGFRQRDTQT